MNTINLLSCKHSSITFSKSDRRVLFTSIPLLKISFASPKVIPVVLLNAASAINLPILLLNTLILLDSFSFWNSISICCNSANPIDSPLPYAQALNQIVLTLLSLITAYIFDSPFTFLTFRLWVLTSLIVRVFFFSSIFTSAEFSSLKILMVWSSPNLRISAPFTQPMSRSSLRTLRSSPLTFSGTLFQLNKYVSPNLPPSILFKRFQPVITPYIFSLPFSPLIFRWWVLTSLIFKVAFSFFSLIFISADFSSLKILMVLPSPDLRISAPSAQPMSRSSLRTFRSSPLTFLGTLSQLNNSVTDSNFSFNIPIKLVFPLPHFP